MKPKSGRGPRILAVVAVVTAILVADVRRAGAANRAWDAARAVLPVEPYVIVGVNVAALRSSKLFAFAMATLTSDRDVAKGLDVVRHGCGIEPADAVKEVVFAMDANQQGAFYVSLKGVGEKEITACMIAAARTLAGERVTAQRQGQVVEYVSNVGDRLYVGWIGADVMVLTSSPHDRGVLERWMGGKGATPRGNAAKLLARVPTGAALWAVIVDGTASSGGALRSAWGAIDLAGGGVGVDVRVKLRGGDEAKKIARDVKLELQQAGRGAAPEVARALGAVKVTASGDEVQARVKLSEDDAVALAKLALQRL